MYGDGRTGAAHTGWAADVVKGGQIMNSTAYDGGTSGSKSEKTEALEAKAEGDDS